MKRYVGMMLGIERTILRVMGEHAESKPHGIYGYELADLLRQETSTSPTETAEPDSLRANGTVYKILYRLGCVGAVTSHWEEPEVALAEGRPRRRYYVLTENGLARAANLERTHRKRLRLGLPETDPRTLG